MFKDDTNTSYPIKVDAAIRMQILWENLNFNVSNNNLSKETNLVSKILKSKCPSGEIRYTQRT